MLIAGFCKHLHHRFIDIPWPDCSVTFVVSSNYHVLGGCCFDCEFSTNEEEGYKMYWKTCSTDYCNTMDPRLNYSEQ